MKHAIAMHRVRGVHQRVGVIAAVRLLGSWPNVSGQQCNKVLHPKSDSFHSLHFIASMTKVS